MRVGISALALDGPSVQSGIARYCSQLVDHLVRLDSPHHFVVYHGTDLVVPERWQDAERLELHPAPGPLARHKTLWEVFGAVPHARARSGVDAWLGTAHALPFSTPLPTALVVHDLFTFSHPELFTRKHRFVVGWSQRRAIAQADHLVPVSEHTREQLIERFDVAPERATTVHQASGNTAPRREPASVTDEELASLGAPSGPFLLALGTLEPRKNLPRLVEALARLRQGNRRRDLELAVVGAPGWLHSPVYDAVRAHDLEGRVHFLGKVPDELMPALFARCAAFVLPSLIEGFGLPVLEAMRLGAPVSCSERGSLPEVGGDAAEYFAPESVDAIVAALERLLDLSAQERSRRVEAGLQQAARFDWSTTAERTLEILERLVATRRRESGG